jgi:putative membrane protein
MGLTWLLGLTLIGWHIFAAKEGWGFLTQPWVIVKLVTVFVLSGWHGFLAGSGRRIAAGERPKSAKFWRATNEIPFLLAIVAVLAVTLQFGQH